MELYLQKFFREHADSWEELLTAAPYSLKIARDNGYMILKYNMTASDFSLPEVKEARGIIFREADKVCVCHPFNKFMNAEESNSELKEIDWASASVQQKIDGSLMKVWFDNGWHISTNGTIDAAKANAGADIDGKTYRDLFVEAVPMDITAFYGLLCKDYTYMFELVSPITQVVIAYPKTKLYLLGVRNNKDHQEYSPEGFTILRHHFDIPNRFPLHSYEDTKKAAEALNPEHKIEDEGFVVCDKYYHRVKVKSPEYVKCHFIRNNNVITWDKIIDIVLTGDIEEFTIYAPDYKEKAYKVNDAIKWFKEKKIPYLITQINPAQFATRKDYALEVKKYPLYVQPFLFRYNDLDNFYTQMTVERWKQILIGEGVI